MSSLPDMLIKMEVISDDLSNEGIQTFHVEQIPFTDEREDACTQTDGHPVCKHDSFKSSFATEVPEIGSEELTEGDMSFYECTFFNSPTAQRQINHSHKDKPVKSMKMLKEKHRENERLRHHSLNQHLRRICKNVPGSAEEGKETKVVMMQRIISYIAYLENTVKFMCSQLGLTANPSWIMLTSSIKDIEESGAWRSDFLGMSSDDSRDSGIVTSVNSRRLKLSSPTIDSTTDSISGSTSKLWSPNVKYENDFQESQDSTTPTSSLYFNANTDVTDGCIEWTVQSENVAMDGPENFDTLLHTMDTETDLFELPSSTFETKLMKSPDEVKWLGSPEKSPSYQLGKSENHFGIRCDLRCMDEQPFDMMPTLSVSPDKVMPKTAIRQETQTSEVTVTTVSMSSDIINAESQMNLFVHDTKLWYRVISCEENQQIPGIYKQVSPKRIPLLNMTNFATNPSYNVHESGEDALNHVTADCCDVKNICPLVELESAASEIKKETCDIGSYKTSPDELAAESEKVLRDAGGDKSTKLDLRKSSWMNGFMMYSRIHRKNFIRENPGLHTSAISRLMGQKWRGMSSEHQQPYRDQARICSRELLQMLDEGGSS